MTPPGPHAMTAQAGAVAVRCRVRGEQAWWYRSPDSFDPSHNPHLIEHEYLYAAPPAAVSVEALQGLVEALRKEAATIAKPYGFVTEHVIGKAEGLESCAERIEQLIKERSNG